MSTEQKSDGASSAPTAGLLSLPDELISRIYLCLPLPDKLRGARVCKRMADCCMNASVLREIDLAPHASTIDGVGFDRICRCAKQATGLSLRGVAFVNQPRALLAIQNLAPTLHRLSLLECLGLNDDNIEALAALTELRGLDIIGTTNIQRPESYDFIGNMKKLSILRIGGTNITARALEPVSSLPCLSAVVLLGTSPAPGPIAEPLSRAKSLKSLVIYVQNLETAPCLDSLAALSNLERLQFGVTRTLETFGELLFLRRLPQLRSLELSSLLLTPACVPALASLTGLVELDLTLYCMPGPLLTDALRGMAGLRSLSLCGVRAAQVADVPALPLLQRARFGLFEPTAAMDEVAAGMARQPRLANLELEFTQTEPASLAALAGLTRLETLFIPAAPHRRPGLQRPEDQDWVDGELVLLAEKAPWLRASRFRLPLGPLVPPPTSEPR